MNRKKEIQVGVTVILSLTVLISGLLWFKQVRMAGEIVRYQVDFDKVGGLQVRDRVQVRGIRAGAVESLDLIEGVVRVGFYVDNDSPLSQDSEISLTSMGIVGEMLLEVIPGDGPGAPPGHLFQGLVMKDMNSMMNEGAETLEEARALTRELTGFMNALQEENRLADMLDNTAAATGILLESTEQIAPDVQALVGELRATNNAVRGIVAGPDSLLHGTLAGAGASLARLDTLTAMLTATTAVLGDLAARLEAGEGTVGRALQDESLYTEAEKTIVAVQDLIADIKARPKRYFHVSLF